MTFRGGVIALLLWPLTLALPVDVSALGISVETKDLLERAEVVVTGKIISRNGKYLDWVHDNHDGRLFTLKEVMTQYEIEISKVIKGDFEDNQISFLGFGGAAEGRQTNWSFGFDCEPGDIVLVFLRKSKLNNVWMVVEQAQGIFNLEQSGDSLKLKNLNQDTLIMKSGDEDLEAFKRRQQEELIQLIEDS
ncbi:MAG: hypothetical protein OQJ84_03420 [Xanthomonadales bacterium]|nr:hypothetical protein [Xanthomonadales bacterium]